jgi:hypothetical protein
MPNTAVPGFNIGSKTSGENVGSAMQLTGLQGGQILQGGLDTTSKGIESLGPVMDLLTKLVKGDQGDITQAAQPEIDQITQQFDQIRNMISMQPRGGGKTTALAEAPFQKAGAIQRTEAGMRTAATGQLGTLGTTLAGLGLSEAGLGTGMEEAALSAATGLRQQKIAGNKTLAQQANEWISAIL